MNKLTLTLRELLEWTTLQATFSQELEFVDVAEFEFRDEDAVMVNIIKFETVDQRWIIIRENNLFQIEEVTNEFK